MELEPGRSFPRAQPDAVGRRVGARADARGPAGRRDAGSPIASPSSRDCASAHASIRPSSTRCSGTVTGACCQAFGRRSRPSPRPVARRPPPPMACGGQRGGRRQAGDRDVPERLDRRRVRALHRRTVLRARASGPPRARPGPARAAPRCVSSVWLIVPRPGRAAITTGRPRATAWSRTLSPGASGTSRPPTPSATSTASAPAARARRVRRRAAPRARARRRPARRRGGARPPGRRCTASRPAGLLPGALRRAARGRPATPGSGSSSAGDDGLERGDARGRARAGRSRSRAASTVLPTPVSVAVTKQPRTAARQAAAALAGLTVEDAARGAARRPSGLGAIAVRAARRRRRPPARPTPGRNPAFSAALPRTCAASCSSALVWDAMTVSRSREVPSGTVGGRIACAKTPRSIASSHMRTAMPASPTISGTIWVVEPATSKPSRASSSRRMSALACSFSTRRGCDDEQLERGQRARDGRR